MTGVETVKRLPQQRSGSPYGERIGNPWETENKETNETYDVDNDERPLPAGLIGERFSLLLPIIAHGASPSG